MHSMHFRSKKEAGIKIVPHWSWIAQDGVSGCVATESGHLCCSFGRSPTGSSHSKSHLVSPELDSTIEVCIPSFNNATAISWWHPECDCVRMRRWKHRRSTNEAPTIHAIPRSRMLSLAVVCYLARGPSGWPLCGRGAVHPMPPPPRNEMYQLWLLCSQ
jgi:hypothetical protein